MNPMGALGRMGDGQLLPRGCPPDQGGGAEKGEEDKWGTRGRQNANTDSEELGRQRRRTEEGGLLPRAYERAPDLPETRV